MLPTSSTWRPSCFKRDCKPATRSAEGPMSTPRRLAPRSIGTPMMRILSGMFCAVVAAPNGGVECSRKALQQPLRIDAIEHAWKGDDLADVLGSANPRDGALEPQTEAGVRNAAVAPEIEVPLKGL